MNTERELALTLAHEFYVTLGVAAMSDDVVARAEKYLAFLSKRSWESEKPGVNAFVEQARLGKVAATNDPTR